MLKEITIGQYLKRDSYVHRLDPRTKVLSAVALITALFMINDLAGYLLMVFFLGLVSYLGQVPLSYLLQGLKPLLVVVVVTYLLNIFTVPGAVIWQVAGLTVTREGVVIGSLIAVRLVMLVAVASLLTLTTSAIDLTDALEKLLSPFKGVGVPAHELAMMMSIALRFIPTLLDEADKIMKAQMARGADFESGHMVRRMKSIIPLLVPLFVGALRRAEELAQAMEARCYRGGEERTRFKQQTFGPGDRLAALSVALVVGAVVWTRVG